MRVHVALTPGDFPDLALGGKAALVVDVLRATSMVVAAFGAQEAAHLGCRGGGEDDTLRCRLVLNRHLG